MIGIWGAHAQTYLLISMVVTTLAFALPIFLMPLRWARMFGWRLPQDPDLALYFGRCLGAFVLIVEALMLRSALTGEHLVVTFEILTAVATMMVIVHAWGAVQRVQPISETVEIAMYGGLGLLNLAFWPPG
jgi:hypothetical protein